MYSPKIKPELVQRLYSLKSSKAEKKPMTRLVNEALEVYLNKEEGKKGAAAADKTRKKPSEQ